MSTDPPSSAELPDDATGVEKPSEAEMPQGQRPQSAMGGASTLEDVMRELLRPVMQGWLDDKLPPVVEQVVRAELARAFREGATTVQRATDP
jgi:hypothetical protein